MIYFDKNLQKLTIPITFNKNITKIVIKNQAKSYEFSDFIVNNDKKNYFVVRFVSEISIEEGQYEYSLYSGDEVFDTGIESVKKGLQLITAAGLFLLPSS